jgi:hypothetical protein
MNTIIIAIIACLACFAFGFWIGLIEGSKHICVKLAKLLHTKYNFTLEEVKNFLLQLKEKS